jgi:hypothetical protein
MTCCGRARNQAVRSSVGVQTGKPPAPGAGQSVQFKYVGSSGMTVVGPISGTRYRFAFPGAVVAVDPRDKAGLARVPTLRAL